MTPSARHGHCHDRADRNGDHWTEVVAVIAQGGPTSDPRITSFIQWVSIHRFRVNTVGRGLLKDPGAVRLVAIARRAIVRARRPQAEPEAERSETRRDNCTPVFETGRLVL